jgi:hypothetical protein
MTDDTLFFSTKSIGTSTRQNRKPQTLLDAIRHNRREIQAELGAIGHIDPTRLCLNQIIAGPGSPAEVVALAKALMEEIGYAPDRRDYTQAFELVFSLPAGTTVNTTLFFNSCMAWTSEKFGGDVILSADVHRDESTPHMHVLVSPIAGGRYLGSKLITKMELDALRKSFAQMALAYGLREPVRKLFGAQRDAVAQLVIGRLEASRDPILQSSMWPMVKHDINSKPGRYAANLGIEIPDVPTKLKRVKTLAELAVSPGKGPRYERPSKAIGFKDSRSVGQYKAIGFESTDLTSELKTIGLASAPEKDSVKSETIPVLVSPKTPTLSTSNRRRTPPAWHGTYQRLRSNPSGLFTNLIRPSSTYLSHISTTRVKNDGMDAGAWDADLGEFTAKPPSQPVPAQHAIRTRAPAVAMVTGDDDRLVERDDFYQPDDFSNYEESPAWQD